MLHRARSDRGALNPRPNAVNAIQRTEAMTAHALMFVDKPTFYRFVAKADERYRYEYVRGWIMQQQAGGTLRHSRIAAAFTAILVKQLSPEVWAVSGCDRSIDMEGIVRYADVVVERVELSAATSLETEHPVLIVEVLSPSSEERDLTVKLAEYTGQASLEAYIVARQDDVHCYVWQRLEDGTFPAEPMQMKSRTDMIHVPRVGVAIPLAEVYRGIVP